MSSDEKNWQHLTIDEERLRRILSWAKIAPSEDDIYLIDQLNLQVDSEIKKLYEDIELLDTVTESIHGIDISQHRLPMRDDEIEEWTDRESIILSAGKKVIEYEGQTYFKVPSEKLGHYDE